MAARKDVTVKIAGDVARDAKIVAAFRELSLAEYLSDALRPIVDADLRRALVERSAEHRKLDDQRVAGDPVEGQERATSE